MGSPSVSATAGLLHNAAGGEEGSDSRSACVDVPKLYLRTESVVSELDTIGQVTIT